MMKKEMKLMISALFLCLATIHGKAQQKTCFPVWTFHDDSTQIHGLSVGLNTGVKVENVKVNGLNLELFGFGILAPLIPHSPVTADGNSVKTQFLKDTVALQINGINLSPLGSFCECNINGFNLNGMASASNVVNGLSLAFFGNFAQISNGAQCSIVANDVAFFNGMQFSFLTNSSQAESNGVQISAINNALNHKGVQVGVINKAHHLKGMQWGFWNKNQKRSLPFINWVFKA
jgi:hypothetical protein